MSRNTAPEIEQTLYLFVSAGKVLEGLKFEVDDVQLDNMSAESLKTLKMIMSDGIDRRDLIDLWYEQGLKYERLASENPKLRSHTKTNLIKLKKLRDVLLAP